MKEKLHTIIFGTDTRAGKLFDLGLIWLIFFSVIVVVLESIPEIGTKYREVFVIIEWIITILFSIEYVLRIFVSPKPFRYIISVWGIIDLIAILPSYLSLFVVGYHYLLIIRIFRILRIFRVLKLVKFTREAQLLFQALKSSSYKISVFLFAILSIITLLGTLMYVIEGGERGFTSIPQSIYWAVVTVTTVGYGDIVPQTNLGKLLSAVSMIIGYAIIAVPTGIITFQLSKTVSEKGDLRSDECSTCHTQNPEKSNFCNQCGDKLNHH